MIITVAGLDPSLRNFGLALGEYDTDSKILSITAIKTNCTDKQTGKTVRQSSDDLRCAQSHVEVMQDWIKDCSAVFGEVPSGSQSARGSFSNGICLGVMGSVGTGQFKGKLLEVSPMEVKMAAIGSKNASKDEMVEWASELYPHLPWILGQRGQYKGLIAPDLNEHMADAIGAINAGVKTNGFLSLISLIHGMKSRDLLAYNGN